MSIQELSKYSWGEQTAQDTLPVNKSSGIQPQLKGIGKISINSEAELTLFDAIHQALQRRPEITQSIATIAGQVQTLMRRRHNIFLKSLVVLVQLI